VWIWIWERRLGEVLGREGLLLDVLDLRVVVVVVVVVEATDGTVRGAGWFSGVLLQDVLVVPV
jgi:hypothetical protein